MTAITLLAKKYYATRLSFMCGIILILWISTQVAIIGYVSGLQPVMFGAGLIILTLSSILIKAK
jgi:hypothetical protein